MARPHAPRPDRRPRPAGTAAATLAAVLALGAGCSQRISGSERLVLAEDAAGDARASDGTPRRAPRREPSVEALRRFSTSFDGRTLPIFAPDGSRCAIQAATTADWAVRVGDPLPPDGMDGRIEVLDCGPDAMGTPVARLDGPWLLGKGASEAGVAVERPRADGGRDVAVLRWDGTLDMLAEDGATNAFATLGPGGVAAWSRRAPEGGDWQLVVQRGDARRVIPAAPGSSLLVPTLAGDGTGVFALRLDGTAMGACWIAFGPDGLPPSGAGTRPDAFRPVCVAANLSLVVRAMEPQSGGAASPPGRGDLVVWSPDAGRCEWWLPGNDMQPLGPGSMAALALEDGDALCTTGSGLRHDRLGVEGVTSAPVSPESWILRPTAADPRIVMGSRFVGRRLEIAALRIEPDSAK